MLILPLTLLLSSSYALVSAGSTPKGGSCSVANNRLQIGTYEFSSDCDQQTYCSSAGVCELKGCRTAQYPFGYPQNATLPPKCPVGQFCPDEGDACQPWLPVGSPCQLNREGKMSCVHMLRRHAHLCLCTLGPLLKTSVNRHRTPNNLQKRPIMVATSTVPSA